MNSDPCRHDHLVELMTGPNWAMEDLGVGEQKEDFWASSVSLIGPEFVVCRWASKICGPNAWALGPTPKIIPKNKNRRIKIINKKKIK